MKKFSALFIALCISLSFCGVVSAEDAVSITVEPIEEPAEPVTSTAAGGSQIYALEAYQLLEQSFSDAYGGYPDHYAGCWLDGDVLHVGITSDDEGTLSIYQDILAPAKCGIEYTVVTYSWNQLMNFNELIWSGYAVDPFAESVSAADIYGINSSGIVADRNCVEITSSQGYSDGLYDALVSFAAELGAGEDIFDLQNEAVEIAACAEEVPPESEEVVEEILALSVTVSENPLLPYFDENCGSVPDWYAGCWLDGDGILHIALTEEADDAMIAECRAVCGDGTIFEMRKYSYNQLEAYKTEALARGLEQGTLISGGIDEYANKAELTVTPSLGEDIPAALTDMLNDLAAEMGVGEDVYLLAVSLSTDEPAEEIVTIAEPAEPVTSPATGDPTTILCLMLSALASVGICLIKKEK